MDAVDGVVYYFTGLPVGRPLTVNTALAMLLAPFTACSKLIPLYMPQLTGLLLPNPNPILQCPSHLLAPGLFLSLIFPITSMFFFPLRMLIGTYAVSVFTSIRTRVATRFKKTGKNRFFYQILYNKNILYI